MSMICPNGHGVQEGKLCSECSAKLVQAPKKQENVLPYEIRGMQVCPGCQYGLGHGHQQFCPNCGHALKWTCR